MIKGVIIEEIFEQRNEYVNSLREKLNDSNRLYIFGAGRIGLDVYKILNKWKKNNVCNKYSCKFN